MGRWSRAILRNDGLVDLPIILMTADAHATGELSMEEIDSYLPKPFDIDDLVDCVARHIRRECSVKNKAPGVFQRALPLTPSAF